MQVSDGWKRLRLSAHLWENLGNIVPRLYLMITVGTLVFASWVLVDEF